MATAGSVMGSMISNIFQKCWMQHNQSEQSICFASKLTVVCKISLLLGALSVTQSLADTLKLKPNLHFFLLASQWLEKHATITIFKILLYISLSELYFQE